jgi:hypothetical protein
MILSSLIHKKSKSGAIATATAATPATDGDQDSLSVANVASVAVANVASVAVANHPRINPRLLRGPEQGFIGEREGEPLHGEQFSYEEDNRRHCRECHHYRNGYCIKQRCRPVDDNPRRCEDFDGIPPVIDRSTCLGHRTSEAEHNAQGRFFKFLITRQDGTQFYSCSMPRMTMKEIRIQFNDAAAIEPVTGENYYDD